MRQHPLGPARRQPHAPCAARLSIALSIALLVAPLSACSSRGPTGPTGPAAAGPPDTAAIVSAIVASGLDATALFPLGEFSLADSATLGTAASVQTVAFRRFVPASTFGNSYTFGDPDAAGNPRRVVALRCRYQKGMLQLVTQLAPDDPTPADSSDRLIDKGMNGDWMRLIELRRNDASSPWRVTAASGVFLLVDDKRSCATCHADLEEVRLQSGARDVTLSADALALDSLVHLAAGAPATVTARSSNDAHVVLLHDAAGSHVLRRVAPGRFAGSLTPGPAGIRHFTVEVLSDSTLFDDRAPVSQHGGTFAVVVDP